MYRHCWIVCMDEIGFTIRSSLWISHVQFGFLLSKLTWTVICTQTHWIKVMLTTWRIDKQIRSLSELETTGLLSLFLKVTLVILIIPCQSIALGLFEIQTDSVLTDSMRSNKETSGKSSSCGGFWQEEKVFQNWSNDAQHDEYSKFYQDSHNKRACQYQKDNLMYFLDVNQATRIVIKFFRFISILSSKNSYPGMKWTSQCN